MSRLLDFAAKVKLHGPPLSGRSSAKGKGGRFSFSTAWLVLTYRCNNRCLWCYAASNHAAGAGLKTWPAEHEDGAVRLLAGLKVPRVILIGGEPTLYPNLEGLVKKLAGAGIRPGLVTNGRMLRNKALARRLAESGLAYATFSIEGSRGEAHDAITQVSGSLAEAVEGLQNAREAGIKVSTNTIISSRTCADLEQIADLLIANGVNNLTYNICGVCMHEQSNNALLMQPREAIKAFERVRIYATSRGAKVRLVTPMPLCNFKPSGVSGLVERGIVAKGPCQLAHGRGFVLDCNGDVLPCTHLTGCAFFNVFEKGRVLGRDEFLRRYRSKFACQFRKKIARYPSKKCSGCRLQCGGGCPIYWTLFNPEEQIAEALKPVALATRNVLRP
jgi:radical SAM protein with 4Fe4S-binding SPASM domain